MLKTGVYTFIFLLILVLAILQLPKIKTPFAQYAYDLNHPQKAVEQFSTTKEILNQFPTIAFKDLPKEYLQSTKALESKYKKMLSQTTYKIVSGNAIFTKLVGDYRIKDFMPRDKYYKANICQLNQDKKLYWLVDERLYEKFQELRAELKKLGHNPNAFGINNGYRHPAYNEKIGGAGSSRHIMGEAIDLQIKDVNRDGSITQKDKSIVLDILEKKVIKNEGGIGRYPGSMVVHFDVRGHRARWDSF